MLKVKDNLKSQNIVDFIKIGEQKEEAKLLFDSLKEEQIATCNQHVTNI